MFVSGTTATDARGHLVGRDDPFRQTVQALDNVDRALAALGSSREAIVRLRVFVRRIEDFDAIARAIGERFRPIQPTMTLVAVSAFVDPAMRIEIEADAEDLPRRRTGRRRSPPSPR